MKRASLQVGIFSCLDLSILKSLCNLKPEPSAPVFYWCFLFLSQYHFIQLPDIVHIFLNGTVGG
ncbi:MAG: hypothetical protein K6B69_04540, partial [Lachnospiraceae bacterium]|nr:hypothetical protein [Lachnospiraceae bacterium]